MEKGGKLNSINQRTDLEQLVFELKKQTLITDFLNIDLIKDQQIRLSVKDKSGYFFIAIKDILYIEAQQENVRIYTENKEALLMYESLKSLEKLLSVTHFIRVHRSFLVNLKQVKKVTISKGYQLEFENGQSVGVSRTYKKQVQQYIQQHRF